MFAKAKFYSVYINPESSEPLDSMEVVKEGFNLWAFLFGGLWAIYSKVWMLLFVYISVQMILVLGMKTGLLTEDLVNMLGLAFNVWIGFEASNFKEESLLKKGMVLVDLVLASNDDEAKIRFLDRYLREKNLHPKSDLTSKEGGKEFIFDDVAPLKNDKGTSFA